MEMPMNTQGEKGLIIGVLQLLDVIDIDREYVFPAMISGTKEHSPMLITLRIFILLCK